MKLASMSTFLALSSLALRSHALPLSHIERDENFLTQRKATYSVVPVDGGAPAAPTTQVETTEATTTIVSTPPPSTLPAATEVSTIPASTEVVTTMIESASGPTSTVVVTMTPGVSPSPLDSPSPAQFAEQTSAKAEITTTDTAYATATADVFVAADPVTVTASSSVSFYDNGMWHTSYAIKLSTSPSTSAWESTSVPTSTMSLVDTLPIPTQNVAQNGTSTFRARHPE